MNEYTAEQLLEFFKTQFVAIDNIPEDTALRDQICLEARASLVIDSASQEELSSLFNVSNDEDILTLQLSTPLSIQAIVPITTQFQESKDVCFSWKFSGYCITKGQIEDYFKISGRWHVKDSLFNSSNIKEKSKGEGCLVQNLLSTDPLLPGANIELLHQGFAPLQEKLKEHFQCHSSFQLAQPLTPYNTPQKICRFFHNEALPLAPLSLSHHFLRLEDIDSTTPLEPVCSGRTEIESVHAHLASMFTARRLPSILLEYQPKQYEGLQQFLFPFKDENNYTVMTVLKCYDDTFRQKSFLPVTRWKIKSVPQRYCMAVPYEKKLLLFNLAELVAHPNSPVVLTDSLEIAALHQAKIEPEKLIFTSFICDSGHYEQVDWKPLKDRQPYLLVTNHSGKTFEEACWEAGKLADYLKGLSIDLKFIRMPVWYRSLPVLHNIGELISAYKAAPPQPYKEDIRILTPEEFETIRETAEQRIGIPPEAWWKTVQEQKTSTSIPSEEKPSASDRFDYILWPLLIRGTSTMLYARKSLGKSALSHSIAACLSAVGKPRLFEENHWGASKGTWNSYKVLYLDFENGETGHKDLLKRVCCSYWRTEKIKQDEDSKNFIWKNMPELGLTGINYTLPENRQKILDMLEAASDEGEPGHPVDVLVIDTYHEFTQLQDQVNTHQGLRSLLRMLNERNIATLVLNHPKPSDDSKMYGHGIILESFFNVMYLKRQGQDSQSLTKPMEVHFNAVRSGWLATNQEPFKIYQPESPGRWHLYSPERSATEERNRIREYYIKTEKFSKEKAASLLGISTASLYRSLNKKDEA